ncbi:MAG: MCP four helix bundle domain-containing protein, partial [Defluviitaleaceae bacterium]|nr:MCP four helix bundle domain-containing protein [Defluviitaleaceae bacterium]
MELLNNMKIRARLLFGFGISLAIAIIISIFGAVNIMRVDADYSYVLVYPNERYALLRDMEVGLMNMRRIVALSVLHIGDDNFLAGYENELRAVQASFVGKMEEYRSNLGEDSQIDANTRTLRLGQINSLESMINQYINTVAFRVIDAAKHGNAEFALSLIGNQGTDMNQDIYGLFNEIFADTQIYMDNISKSVTGVSVRTMWTLLILSAIGILLGTIVSVIISQSVTKPLGEVVHALCDVATGKLNINLQAKGTSETGVLAKSTQDLTNTLQALMDDMDHMADNHDRGETDSYINADRYEGAYGNVAKRINYMMDAHLKTQMRVVEVFTDIANGNFEAQLERLPGKKAKLNDAVENMRNHITRISQEVKGMIQSAVSGQLSVKIEENKYNGGWREIMEGLNQVIIAIEAPIAEIDNVMSKLSKGEFKTKVAGSYKGSFLSIREAVNGTIDALSGYITEMSEILSAIADGDLTKSIRRDYVGNFSQMKDSINNISKDLNKTMSEISAAADQLLTGASQISSSSMDLANGTTTQASSVEELTAAAEIINRQTLQNADSADNANELSSKSNESAQAGNMAMKQMLDAMIQIKESSGNISKIIKTIQD